MGRIGNLNPQKFESEFIGLGMKRLRKAAKVLHANIKKRTPVGTTRPIYKTGAYAGEPWTARDAGELKKSVRIVEKKKGFSIVSGKFRNIRVYVGHYLAWYAQIVEYSGKHRRFMRKGINASKAEIRNILENG